ncbi:putative phosphoribosyl transferase [Asanoa hainanensis]|uniref:Putative phosphoribosyl transferase n=1 Tax=Asanoa hainanensis TaxID=560556 RepID=A0A239P1E7_9ACTN|nr:phosphoribosyltransferase family protein [Asanoa hainanensis]SNT60926.1 putative phosphoribosyl transferase [Asanoa hainanensis]
MAFRDRADAGRRLANRLDHLRGCDAVVLGVTRGGVPVALEVARALDLPLDVVVVERIQDPFVSAVTLGAVAEGGISVFDDSALSSAWISEGAFGALVAGLVAEVERRARAVRAGRASLMLARRTALLVDDGVATGATALAAVRTVRARGAQRVVLAVPVAEADAMASLDDEVDETVCVDRQPWVPSIGRLYREYPPTTYEEVAEILHRAGIRSPYRGPRSASDRAA